MDDVKAIVLDENGFWNPLIQALRIMTPLVQMMLRMTDGDKPIMGKIYDRMFLISERIRNSKVPWKAQAMKIHEDRWEYLHSPMHSAGYALDPEFWETKGAHDTATQEGLLTVMQRICLRDIYETASASEREALTLNSDVVQERVSVVELQLSHYQEKEGAFSRLAVRNNATVMAPATWWSTYGKHLKELQSVAMRVLAQPAAASSAERNWSIYSQIKNDKRSQLSHEHADYRVYCHEALHLREKLQTAKYTQDVEKWESDLDSDASDEEDISALAR